MVQLSRLLLVFASSVIKTFLLASLEPLKFQFVPVWLEAVVNVYMPRDQTQISEDVVPGSVLGDSPGSVCRTVGVKVPIIFTDGAVLDTTGEVVGLGAGLLTAAHSGVDLGTESTAQLRAP